MTDTHVPAAPEPRIATRADVPLLVSLMDEFYAESGYRADAAATERAFNELVSTPSLGAVWLLFVEGDAAGYAVLTFGFSMEYGGRDAFVDDLFLRRAYRGKGNGAALLATLRSRCLEQGVRAMHLEVGRENERAQRLYRTFGFRNTGRELLTLRIAEPVHR